MEGKDIMDSDGEVLPLIIIEQLLCATQTIFQSGDIMVLSSSGKEPNFYSVLESDKFYKKMIRNR